MNILLTNDDGYKAEGFYELKHALEREGHFVIACSTVENVSGCGSGRDLSLHWEVEVHEDTKTPIFAMRTDSTVNCVDFGEFYFSTLGEAIDLVLVGINHGPNTTWKDLYNSGSVGAEAYAASKKYPVIIFSEINGHYKYFVELAGFVAQKLKTFAIEKETFINVNFPDCEPQKFGSVVYLPSNVDGGWRRYFTSQLKDGIMMIDIKPVRERSIADEVLSQNKIMVQFLRIPYE